jgi:hypothetical protein
MYSVGHAFKFKDSSANLEYLVVRPLQGLPFPRRSVMLLVGCSVSQAVGQATGLSQCMNQGHIHNIFLIEGDNSAAASTPASYIEMLATKSSCLHTAKPANVIDKSLRF